ncbi:hypothetical protein CDD83_8267 [Cordyceps sp. RAO-2017]|nr:hypothetical protein CDD83_8267 [Cordyceps sp. RAO-2017]
MEQKQPSTEQQQPPKEQKQPPKEQRQPPKEQHQPPSRSTGGHIVVLKAGLLDSHLESHLQQLKNTHKNKTAVQITHSYYGEASGFHGYAGHFPPRILKSLRQHPEVEWVEENELVQIPPYTIEEPESDGWGEEKLQEISSLRKRHDTSATQWCAPWNLHAISHRSSLPNLQSSCFWTYYYNSTAGENTYAYVIDSGVRITHEELEGRASHGCTIKTGCAGCSGSLSDHDDLNGHGTHVAGIIAARTYGVAKKARVIAVKVFDENGEALRSDVIEAFLWAVNEIRVKGRRDTTVITISWGRAREGTDALATVIDRAFDKLGIITVVSSENYARPALENSPACAAKAITVGSIGKEWSVAAYSNFGCEVDILAPGRSIISLSENHDSALKILTGTSMATPHVAGLVLNAMSVHGIKGAESVKQYIFDSATRDKVTGNLRGARNLVANNNYDQQNSLHPI